MTRRVPSRIGRPVGADPVVRRQQILTAARVEFARVGYQGTTLSGVAKDAGITLTALYHYFDDKAEMYEAVFEDALQATWQRIHEHVMTVEPAARGLYVLVDAMASSGIELDEERQSTAMFLATVPIEAARYPELHHLLERRRKVQEGEVRALVEPAWEAGKLPGFTDLDTAIRALRIVIMGWAIETYLQRERSEEYRGAIMALFGQLGAKDAFVAPGPGDLITS